MYIYLRDYFKFSLKFQIQKIMKKDEKNRKKLKYWYEKHNHNENPNKNSEQIAFYVN